MSQPPQSARPANTVTAEVAARLLKLTPAELTKLADDGHVPRVGQDAFSIPHLVQGYIDYLKAEGDRAAKRPTQAEIGLHLDLSDRSIRTLAAEWGVDSKQLTLSEWRIRYIQRLREMAAGRATEGGLDLAEQRARLAKEQADKVAMANAERRNELAPMAVIVEVLAKAGSRAARILDTIPALIRRREPSLSADTMAAIAAEVAKARNFAASVSLDDLNDDDESTQSSRDEEDFESEGEAA